MHFPLHPETPAEGRLLEDLFAGSGMDVDAMNARLKGRADAEGLPYGVRTHTYNSRLAQELACWAETQTNGAAIHDAVFRAYFVDGQNIGDIEILVARAESVGLSPVGAREALAEGRFREQVDADWAKSRSQGVTGVPTFAAGGQQLVGAHPYEALEEFLKQLGTGPRRAGGA